MGQEVLLTHLVLVACVFHTLGLYDGGSVAGPR